jgi:hypothetical protein
VYSSLRFHSTAACIVGSVVSAIDRSPVPEARTSDKEPASALGSADLPELFASADARAVAAQRHYLRATQWQLGLLVVAAGVGAYTWGRHRPDPGGIATAVLLFVIAIIKTHVLLSRSERIWYQSRAAAESAKTLAWRYAVGGEPFGIRSVDGEDADRLLISRLRDVLEPLSDIALPLADDRGQITPKMRQLRSSSLGQRKATYERGRVADQCAWYAAQAEQSERRSQRWQWTTLAAEIVGGAFAILRATTSFPLDVRGLAVAVVGVSAAWVETRQYSNMATAYSVTARELTDVKMLVPTVKTEQDWSTFVENAEQAISREHTLWQAARGGSLRKLHGV